MQATEPRYRDPAPFEVARAVGLGLTIAGGAATALIGGEVFVKRAPLAGIVSIASLLVGVTLLMWSRRRLAVLWEHNKPYLMGPGGTEVLHARRDHVHHALWWARGLLALFVVLAISFYFLFSAISCGDNTDGYCGQVGTPPEPLVVAVQLLSLGVGCAWAAVVYWRRRYESETEKVDVIVADGARKRRSDDPLSSLSRYSWE